LAHALELKLQVDFLDARSVWLQSELESLEQRIPSNGLNTNGGALMGSFGGARGTDAPYQWLLDIIEKNRTLWFEIGTQFRAIFNCELGVGSLLSGDVAANRGVPGGTAYLVLSSWLLQRIEGFVKLLKRMLPLLQDGASLHDILDQTMFFGASLGRLGADFRPLVVPLFEDAITNLVVSRWNVAEIDFGRALKSKGSLDVLPLHLPVSRHRSEDAPSSATSSVHSQAKDDDAGNASVDLQEPPEPPLSTLAFPALAHAVNMYVLSL
jgi:hypothetical protein